MLFSTGFYINEIELWLYIQRYSWGEHFELNLAKTNWIYSGIDSEGAWAVIIMLSTCRFKPLDDCCVGIFCISVWSFAMVGHISNASKDLSYSFLCFSFNKEINSQWNQIRELPEAVQYLIKLPKYLSILFIPLHMWMFMQIICRERYTFLCYDAALQCLMDNLVSFTELICRI